MFKQILSLALVMSASTAFASNVVEPYEAAVGAEVLIQQVISKRLLPKESSNFYAMLNKSIVGSGSSKTHVEISKMECDRALGADDCVIQFLIQHDHDKEGSSFELQLHIREGNIRTAKIGGFIG